MLKNARFGGVNAAVLTAMNADLSIDLDRMAARSACICITFRNNRRSRSVSTSSLAC